MPSQHNEAYDFSRFEPKRRQLDQPAEKNNVIALPQEQLEKNARPKLRPARLASSLAVLLVILGTVGSLVYGQVRLTELTDSINQAEKDLSEQESVYTQLQMKSGSVLSLDSVEDYAKNSLGMRKAENSQIEYISMAEQDEGTVLQSSGEENLFEKIWNWFQQLLA